jgi:hypothetical protein
MAQFLIAFVLVVTSIGLNVDSAHGQLRPGRPGAKASPRGLKTEVSFELISDRKSPRLAAQRWGATFQRLGVNARIRPSRGTEKLDIKETKRGTLRFVTVVGEIDSNGSLVFPGRRFGLADAAKLGDWILELKTYGAQGKADGKPGFGLSNAQFGQVFSVLGTPTKGNWEDLNFPTAIKQLEVPRSMPLRFSASAQQYLKTHPPTWKTPESMSGFSKGTALAIVLNNAGLGFKPGRTPEGNLELLAIPLSEDKAIWPIGWPLTKGPINVVPKLVEIIPVELEDVPLPDVLMAATLATKVPIIVDNYRPAKAKINIDRIIVNQPLKKMSWSGLLDRATFPKLMREQLTDEAGKPFVWITTRSVKQMNERSKQRNAQFTKKK